MYTAIGGDLARLGINTNLAPCADVLTAGGSPAVGTRSFGADPHLVARHVAAAVTALQEAGVAAAAKHFPGHGSTAADSHLTPATVPGVLAHLRSRDLPPFEAAIAPACSASCRGTCGCPSSPVTSPRRCPRPPAWLATYGASRACAQAAAEALGLA